LAENKSIIKRRVGRPLKFQSVEDMAKQIDAYFDDCDSRTKKHVTKEGTVIQIPNPRPYTITGLAIFLHTTRDVLSDYQGRDEYAEIIQAAKLRVENFVEESLWTPKISAGVIFNLKNNFGWKDAQAHELSGPGGEPFNLVMNLGVRPGQGGPSPDQIKFKLPPITPLLGKVEDGDD
jgi:hypothetical protein